MNERTATVRPYRPDDQQAISRLAPRLAEGVSPWRDREAVDRAVVGWVAGYPDVRGRDGAAVFVAEISGDVVGFVGVSESSHFSGEVDAYVGELVVARGSVRCGVGASLMAAVDAWASRRGYGRVSLETGWANVVARRFYAELGYEPEGLRLSKPVSG